MPVAERPDVRTLDNFIGGRWVPARATEFFDVHNPAVGNIIGRTPLSTADDVNAAVQAAAQAFPAWRDTPVNARAQFLYRFKALCEAHFEELARTVTTDHGKTLDEARGSVRRGIECVEVACGAPSLMLGFGLEDISKGVDCHVVRQPGAKLLVDGRTTRVDDRPNGYFVGPTVFDDVSAKIAIGHEEVFGPVASICPVKSLDETIAMMKAHPNANATSIFTSSGKAAREFAKHATASMVGVNIGVAAPMAYFPFGGAKDSFFGDLEVHGRDGIEFYTDKKVTISRWL